MLAETLRRAGNWSVFWDRTIPAGLTWYDFIGKALDEAPCIIVMWSTASVSSDWVREEADEGKKRRVLLPVFIEAVTPPVGFRAIQGIDLSNWDGTADGPEFELLVDAVKRIAGFSQQAGRDSELLTIREAEPAPMIREREIADEASSRAEQHVAERQLTDEEQSAHTNREDEEQVGEAREESDAPDLVTGPGVQWLQERLGAIRRKSEPIDRAGPESAGEVETEGMVLPRAALVTGAVALGISSTFAVFLLFEMFSSSTADLFRSFSDGVLWFYWLTLAGPGAWALKQVTTMIVRSDPVLRNDLDTIVQVLAGVAIVTVMCAAVLRLNDHRLFSSLTLELAIMCLPSLVAWRALLHARRRGMPDSSQALSSS